MPCEDEMLPEYDFSNAQRGKYHLRYSGPYTTYRILNQQGKVMIRSIPNGEKVEDHLEEGETLIEKINGNNPN